MELFWSCDLILCHFVPIYKIWAKSINPAQSYGYFFKIQDGACCHLVSPKMIILVTLSTSRCHSALAYQICWESAHLRHRNGTFMKSKLAAAAILNFW